MNPDQATEALTLFQQHAYGLLSCLIAALLIGAAVRLLKADSPIPLLARVPPVWRLRAALALGLVAAGIAKAIESGATTWQQALTWGLGAAFTAIVGHQAVIEGIRGGKELGLSGGQPPSASGGSALGGGSGVTGAKVPPTLRYGFAAAALLLAGCSALTPRRVLAVESQVRCILTEPKDMPLAEKAALCGFEHPEDAQALIDGETQRAAAARQEAVASCGPR